MYGAAGNREDNAYNKPHKVDKKQFLFIIIFLVLDIVLVILVFTPYLVLNNGVYPFRRGFYCDDESLMHPYNVDTVKFQVVIAVGLTLPIVAFFCTEFLYYRQMRNIPFYGVDLNDMDLYWFRSRAVVNNILYSIANLLAGFAIVLTITEVGKETVGRLRPHFFSACKPNWTAITCQTKLSDVSGVNGTPLYTMAYVEKFQCTETNAYMVKDSMRSFPSGHSSVSMYFMVFLALYVQYRIHWNKLYFLKVFLQTLFFLMALYTALSRISDYKHHWSDVLSGSLIGIAVAFYIVFAVWRLPQRYWVVEQYQLEIKSMGKPLKKAVITSPYVPQNDPVIRMNEVVSN
jgi:phosphatidate phosphatase